MPTFSTETVVAKGTDIFDKLNVMRDAYITGQISKDEYNKQYAELKTAGLDQIQAEVGEAYNAVK